MPPGPDFFCDIWDAAERVPAVFLSALPSIKILVFLLAGLSGILAIVHRLTLFRQTAIRATFVIP